MLLKVFRTGHEQPHWFGQPFQLDTAPPFSRVQIICEDHGIGSVSFNGHLHVRTSRDGTQTCVNVLLNTSGRPSRCPSPLPTADNHNFASAVSATPAPPSLCIPLPREAVSCLRPRPGQPEQFELRLRDLRVDFVPQTTRPGSIRAARRPRAAASTPSFSSQVFHDTPERYSHHGDTTWCAAAGH